MRVTFAEIVQAGERIRPFAHHTLLRYSPFLSEISGAEVWLKLENLQPTGSFKVRGALNKLHQHKQRQPDTAVVTASAGNHGLGVAYAAQCWGSIAATVFVPTNAPQAKVSKLHRFPITLIQQGESYEEAHQQAALFAAQTGAIEISAYDDPEVIAGQGTIGLEIFADLPQADALLVPVGGGGMIAGINLVARALCPGCRVLGVQPEASPAALLSLRDGVAYDPYAHAPTIADGLAGGFGRLPFALTQGQIEIALASETELYRAIYTLLAKEQLVIEASGAIAITPLLRQEPALVGKRVVCVLSGGNLDISLLKSVLNQNI